MQFESTGLTTEQAARWKPHFIEHQQARQEAPTLVAQFEKLPFGDGGYLDNKPFGYAIDAIAQRRGGSMGRVERKLIYIEPDPERIVSGFRALEAQQHVPNAVESALIAQGLPRYETIREELLRLRDRNRLVDKVFSVVRGVDADFELLDDDRRKALATTISGREDFDERDLKAVVSVFGAAYGGYHRLKVAQLTDDLTEAVAADAGIGMASDEFRALRLLVRTWRAAHYVVNREPKVELEATNGHRADTHRELEFALLEDFDLAYRVRRLSFVLERLNQLRALSVDRDARGEMRHEGQTPTATDLVSELKARPHAFGSSDAAWRAVMGDALARQLDGLRRELSAVLRTLRQSRDVLLGRLPRQEPADATSQSVGAAYANMLRGAVHEVMELPTERARAEKATELMSPDSAIDKLLGDWIMQLGERVNVARTSARKDCERLLDTDSRPHATAAA